MERDRGTVLALAGVALLVVALAASAALAPPRDVAAAGANGTLVGVQGAGTNLHETGNVHLSNGSEIEWKRSSADSYFEVEQLSDGRFVVAFIEGGHEDCGQFDPPCPRTGYRVLDPGGDPAVVSEWSFPVRTKGDSELHSVEPLGDGRFAVADMEYERIAVVEDGSITWQWNASSFYDPPPDPTQVDWLHINDVNAIGDGRFLVSVRNANQILVVERGEGVVEVINEDRGEGSEETCRIDGELVEDSDGEVRCGNPETIHRQHNPHWLGDGAVLVADSDNDRVVELHRTEDGWEPVWSLESAGRLPFDWPRDADRLPNGNTLVSDTFNKRIVEINESGDLVGSTSIEDLPYEADRLPHGEQQDVPRYAANGSGVIDPDTEGSGGDVPILSTVVVALQSGIPGMPYWVGELQVLLVFVALVLVVAGLVDRYRG